MGFLSCFFQFTWDGIEGGKDIGFMFWMQQIVIEAQIQDLDGDALGV